MSDVILRVGAALDFNPDTVFEPLVKASARAAKLIEKNLNAAAPRAIGGGSSGGGGSSVQARAERLQEAAMRRLHREVESWHRKQAQLEVQQERQKEAAFRRLAKETEQAQRKQAQQEAQQERRKESAAQRQAKEAERAAEREAALRQRGERELARQREVSARQVARSEQIATRERVQLSRLEARNSRGLRPGAEIARGGFFSSIGGSVWHGTQMVASPIKRIPMAVARGVGIDTDVESAVSRSTKLESSLSSLALQSWIPAQGKKYTSPDEILKRIRPSANEAGYSYGEAVDSLSKFVSKTGDLDMGLQVFDRMAKLSRATGTELSHMVDAVGDVANGLGDIPDKAAVMHSVMATIAGQGKIGAVEIKDLASKMARIAAVAPHFTVAKKDKDGNVIGMESDAAGSMKVLGGFAQIIRAQGGKATASETMTSVSAFFNQFSKTARLKGFEKFGVNAITDDGKIRDPREVLKEALVATTGKGPTALKDQRNKLNAMFADERAKPIVTALQKTYGDAYTGTQGTEREKIAAGKAAIQAEFDRMEAIQMSSEEISMAFSSAANTTEAKVAKFNNAMTDAGTELRLALLPTIDQALPHFVDALKFAGEGLSYLFEYVLKPILKWKDPDRFAELDARGKTAKAEAINKYIKNKGYDGVDLERVRVARSEVAEARDIWKERRDAKHKEMKDAEREHMNKRGEFGDDNNETRAALSKYHKARAEYEEVDKRFKASEKEFNEISGHQSVLERAEKERVGFTGPMQNPEDLAPFAKRIRSEDQAKAEAARKAAEDAQEASTRAARALMGTPDAKIVGGVGGKAQPTSSDEGPIAGLENALKSTAKPQVDATNASADKIVVSIDRLGAIIERKSKGGGGRTSEGWFDGD